MSLEAKVGRAVVRALQSMKDPATAGADIEIRHRGEVLARVKGYPVGFPAGQRGAVLEVRTFPALYDSGPPSAETVDDTEPGPGYGDESEGDPDGDEGENMGDGL